jgi:hypothetical protein
MSRVALEEILARAMEDHKFRERLLQSPAEALAGYDLSEEERQAFIAGNLQGLLRSVDRDEHRTPPP